MKKLALHGTIEVGRIYLQPNKSQYIIHCQKCGRAYYKSNHFEEHIKKQHGNIYKKKRLHPSSSVSEINKKPITVEEPEIVLIADNNEEPSNQEEYTLNNIKIALTEEDLETEKQLNGTVKLQENDHTQSILEIEPLTDTDVNEYEYESATDTEEDSLSEPAEVEEKSKQPRIFYNLRTTNPKIIFHFIKLIEKNPCHWDINHEYYGSRVKRQESAVQIENQLNTYWHIKTTTSVILASITGILHWYEKEFNRLKEVNAEPSQFRQYYEALARFLLPMHLKSRKCNECNRVYRSQSHLLSHMHLEHSAPIPFKCGYCERTFVYESMKRHHENRHTLKEYYSCRHCKYRAPNKTDLQIHMTMHTNVRAYICDICGASYKSSTSFNVHKRTHGEPRFRCNRCGKAFYENYRYKCHMELHAMENTPLKCEFCGIEFPTRFAVKEHIKAEHGIFFTRNRYQNLDNLNTNSGEFENNVRELAQELPQNELFIALHTDAQVNTGEANAELMVLSEIPCDYCSKSYITTDDLLVHIEQEHGGLHN